MWLCLCYVFSLLGCAIPLELLCPLHLHALALFRGLHFLYFLLDLRPLQNLICEETPSDQTLFLETGNIFIRNIVKRKWRILFQQFVYSFGTRCATLSDFKFFFCESVLIFERPPERILFYLCGVLFLSLENVLSKSNMSPENL